MFAPVGFGECAATSGIEIGQPSRSEIAGEARVFNDTNSGAVSTEKVRIQVVC